MVTAKRQKKLGFGILLLLPLFWMQPAVCAAVTEEEKNNISVYEKAADGVVNITTDATAVLDKFRNLVAAPTKIRCDIEPRVPDRRINITDVVYTIDAFRGAAYPFAGPAPEDLCP